MPIKRKLNKSILLSIIAFSFLLISNMNLFGQTCYPSLPDPVIALGGTEEYLNFEGTPYIRYRIPVQNWASFPNELFVSRPDLPPCGLNNDAARSWVEIYDASDDSYIYGFCDLGSAGNLQLIWFGLLPGVTPPASVYIKIIDREPSCGNVYTSAPINVYAPTSPVANSDSITTTEDTQSTKNVLVNDTDINGDTLDVTGIQTNPLHGTVLINANNTIRYTPYANYHGPDSFSYIVSDGTYTTTGSVSVTVTSVLDDPIAVADIASVNEDSSVTVDVLANDDDYDIPYDGDVLAIQSVAVPSHGNAAIAAGGILYTPAANYNGPDSFSYTMNDGTGTTPAIATVNITVNSIPDAPDQPSNLQTDSSVNPINVSNYAPLFSWTFSDADEADPTGDSQTAYQIRIGTLPGASDVWDSGKVTSTSGSSPYSGIIKLTPNITYYWSGQVWDEHDLPSGYSADGTFVILDIGLRIFDGTETIEIAVDYVSSAYALRIQKGGTTYGIILVDPLDPSASKIRIQTSLGVKAIKKM